MNTIYFYLTEGCNLCCRHCWIDTKYQAKNSRYASLEFGLFESILDQAKPLGLSTVKLTGGEPLIHPQIKDILRSVRQRNLRLIMETNGVSCSSALAEEIVKCRNPYISVSIDSIDAATHDWIRGVRGSFDKAVEGIKNLVKAGLRPQIIMTMMRCNKDQLEQVVRLAESLGADSVKFNLLQPVARGENAHQQHEALGIEELVKLGGWVENTLSAKTKLRLFYSHPLAFRPLGRIFGAQAKECRICSIFSIIGVLASGSYALCGIGQTVPELVFGDARKDRLQDVWNNAAVLKSLRKDLPAGLQGICGECLMKGRCLAYCVAINYYRNKSLLSECWYCSEARKKGLFPETRLRMSLERRI